MNLDNLFFAIRFYTALITLGAGLIIWMYGRLVKNPSFSIFVRKFWVLLLLLGIQGMWGIFHANFPLTDDNMIFVIIAANVKSWIFFGYLPSYLKQKRRMGGLPPTSDPNELADRAFHILDF